MPPKARSSKKRARGATVSADNGDITAAATPEFATVSAADGDVSDEARSKALTRTHPSASSQAGASAHVVAASDVMQNSGQNAAAAAATSMCTSAGVASHTQSVPSSSPSLAQRCYADALLSIFANLTLRELVPAAHLCRAWMAVAVKVSRAETLCVMPGRNLSSLWISPLRHVVTGMQYWTPATPLLELRSLSALPRLRSLYLGKTESHDVMAATDDDLHTAFALPGLQYLGVNTGSLNGPAIQRLLNALGQGRQPTLQHLYFTSGGRLCTSVDLSPLQQLPALQTLSLSIISSPEHARALKQLSPSLRSLDFFVGEIRPELLREMCTPPHALQGVEYINLDHTHVGASELEVLASLPSLKKLTPMGLAGLDFSALTRMPALKVLRAIMRGDEGQGIALAAALRQCGRLEELNVRDVLASEVDSLMSSLPRNLKNLTCAHMFENDDEEFPLAALQQHAPQLQNLTLGRQCNVRFDALMKLRLPALHSLNLSECSMVWSKDQRMHLRSQILPVIPGLPALRHFWPPY